MGIPVFEISVVILSPAVMKSDATRMIALVVALIVLATVSIGSAIAHESTAIDGY